MSAYFVTVERRGVPPPNLRLLLRAESKATAGSLAAHLAERESGGSVEPVGVRRAPWRRGLDFDAAA
ncbi:MAG: hypothetical protein E6G08_01650 [Actinobacteria bacterium]|nr:MAG: hypothetical protein E6G08_01650 [Actinomycetota bacterium]